MVTLDVRDREEVARLTETYGGQWGINHTHRLLHLISIIGEGLPYDAEVVWLAAHLHDWGGYSPWIQVGVDHAHRSVEVARQYLSDRGAAERTIEAVLECIENHHKAGDAWRIETILLRDADALDFLGAIGVLRDFSKKPGDLRRAYETVVRRKEQLAKVICLKKAQEIAAERIREMDQILEAFSAESFGYF
jgi:uncharacterized protein